MVKWLPTDCTSPPSGNAHSLGADIIRIKRKHTMRILVVNCNTSVAMTEEIAGIARSAARTGTEIVGTQPEWGPASAEGYYDSFMSAAAVLEHLTTWAEPFDAVVMAGFGEHGREGARQLLDVPVVDITDRKSVV